MLEELVISIPGKLWGFSRFHSDCAHTNGKSFSGTAFDQKDYITDSCAQILLQLSDLYDPNKVSEEANFQLSCYHWNVEYFRSSIIFADTVEDQSHFWIRVWSGGC